MGAVACSCTGDRKQEEVVEIVEAPLDFKWDNHRFFSIENYLELGEVECHPKYKNVHEVRANLQLTKSKLTAFFKN